MKVEQEHIDFPKVCISLLNWMNFDDTIKCIESVLQLNYPNFYLIIRDNASPNDSFERIQQAFPNLKVIQSTENNGFAAGHYENYLIAKKEGADLFWILNSDLEVDKNALLALVEVYLKKGDHVYGSVSLNPLNPELVDFGGAPFTEISNQKLTYNCWKHKPYKDLIKEHSEFYEVESVEGSSMMIPMSVIEKYGFMKLDFFMYGEETDYSYHLRKYGVKSILSTNSIVYHINEGSTQLYPKLKVIPIYYRRRNALRFSVEYLNMSRWEALAYQNGTLNNMKAFLKGWLTRKKDLNYFYALGCLHAFLGEKGKVIHPEQFIQ